MFEQHIDRVFIDLMDKIAFGGGFAYITDIVGMAPISRPWRAFLLAEVDWWVYEQQIARVGNPNFDFSHEEFVYAFQHLDSLYADKARFTNDNLTKILKTAVKTRLNMLLRPRTTLKWFVFRGEPTKPYREIILRLNYLNDYKYISDGFVAHVERNEFLRSTNDIMSVNEFEKIIDEVDNEKIFNVTPQEFLDMVEPIFGFFNNEATPDESDTIPTAALAIFFDDKGIFVLSKKLKQAIRNGETEITRRFLADFIYSSIEDSDRPDYTPETALPIASATGFSLADELARFNQAHQETDELPNFGLGVMPESFFPKPLQDSEDELLSEEDEDKELADEIDALENNIDSLVVERDESQEIVSEVENGGSAMLLPNEMDLSILESEDALGAEEYLNGELALGADSEVPNESTADDFEAMAREIENADLSLAPDAIAQDVEAEEVNLEDISDASIVEASIENINLEPGSEELNPEEVLQAFELNISESITETDDEFASGVEVVSAADANENEVQTAPTDEEADLSDLLAQFGSMGFADEAQAAPTDEATVAPTQEEKLSMIMDTLSGSIDPEEMRREEERRKLEESLREATEDKILEMNNASSSLDFLNLPQSSGEDDSGFIVFDDEISEDLLNIAFKNKEIE